MRRDRLKGAKSLLVDAKAKPVIILNTSDGRTGARKKRFTPFERFLIAHELGHLVLYQRGARSPSGQSEYWKLEKLCDAFARQLLIPENFVLCAVNQTKPTALERLTATLRIAEECSVQWAAAALRVAEICNDTVFFRLLRAPSGGLKVVVSTSPNRQGIGQCIKQGTPLYETFRKCFEPQYRPRAIPAEYLCGVGGMHAIQSGALYSDRGGLALAVMPV